MKFPYRVSIIAILMGEGLEICACQWHMNMVYKQSEGITSRFQDFYFKFTSINL